MIQNDRKLLSDRSEIEKLRKKRFFITGATGFFGLNLLESLAYLNEEFHLEMELTLLVRSIEKAKLSFAKHGISFGAIQFLEGDLLENFGNFAQEKTFDFVLHFAANANLDLLRTQPEVERKIIIDGTQAILDFSLRDGCKNIVFLSSGAVYGKQPQEILRLRESDSEKHSALSTDPYGSAKILAEKSCLEFAKKHGLNLSVLRGFAFAGPHLKLDAHYAIGNLVQNALNGGPIVVRDGSTVRSYLYSVDSILWILKAAVDSRGAKVYNLGSDELVTMEELANKISLFTGNPQVQILQKSSEPNRYVPNIDLIQKELGVRVYTSLDQTIQNMIEWNQ